MIKLAICDDEPFMLDSLSAQLSDYMKEKRIPHQIHCFENGRVLLNSIEDFDLIFLDIQMDEPDGMETAHFLRKKGYPNLLIFITILKESVFDAFEVQAFDYLVKPLDRQHLNRTLDRAVKTLEEKARRNLFIKKGNSSQIIPFSQIVYCEVLGRKIYIHQQGGKVTDYYDRLEHLEKSLDRRFFRCHRSYLVNLDYVRGYRDRLLSLASFGGETDKIPVSRLREQELTHVLLAHMKERRW